MNYNKHKFKIKGEEKQVKSNELLPFIRNRYYKGKMLTSSDFEAEQMYMNHKRRFINQMINGSGIACGLNVISLDDLSLMIESGMAIDATGREIVVENSIVKKLSAIVGFEDINTECISLCIRYKENDVQPIYAINRQTTESEYEYNRIQDDYELYLVDTEALDNTYVMESEFYSTGILFQNQDYIIQFRIPADIAAGCYVKAEVEVIKQSDAEVEIYYETVLQVPALASLEGVQEIHIIIDDVKLDKDQTYCREYWLLAQKEEFIDTSVMQKNGCTKIFIDGEPSSYSKVMNCKINVVNESINDLVIRGAAKSSFEFRRYDDNADCVRLADLKLIRTESAYIIESIDEKKAKKYIPTLADECKRNEYSKYFVEKIPMYERNKLVTLKKTEESLETRDNLNVPRIETGIVEIPIGENAKKGDICYSGEIMHGLGKGNVYVEVGYEYLEQNEMLGRNAKTTVYGNPILFDIGTSQVSAETAVKVLNDKGSFIVALKLLQNVRQLVLTYRWVAIKYDNEKLQDEMVINTNQSISAITPTIVLGAKDSYFFQVKYNNMKECSICYELTEPGSGEITSDGIYTAPAKEGVYEIRIYCADKPLICTYAYAIVKKKTAEELIED